MALDFSALVQNDFYRKKFRRAVEVRDVNRDGCISRADFDIMVERCKNLDSSTPKHLERLTQHMKETCDFFGLVDDSVKYTYSEFEDKWFDIIKEWFAKGTTARLTASLFQIVDINEDGFISFEEWVAYHQIVGMDTAHARASFDAIDTNHDGKISEDEFVKSHVEFFCSSENKLNSAILFGPLE